MSEMIRPDCGSEIDNKIKRMKETFYSMNLKKI